jgi:hypothetical protein
MRRATIESISRVMPLNNILIPMSVSTTHSALEGSHDQIEQELQESGMAWTMLRPHHFMQNLLGQADRGRSGVVHQTPHDARACVVHAKPSRAADQGHEPLGRQEGLPQHADDQRRLRRDSS